MSSISLSNGYSLNVAIIALWSVGLPVNESVMLVLSSHPVSSMTCCVRRGKEWRVGRRGGGGDSDAWLSGTSAGFCYVGRNT